MRFADKLKTAVAQFMQGRYGPDQLSLALVYGGLTCYILDLFLGIGVSTVGLALYVYSFFRILSRNKAKRCAENQRFLTWWNPCVTKIKQAKRRFELRKQFKYFKCPQCKSWLRLARGAGEVNVTCGRCHNRFLYKA